MSTVSLNQNCRIKFSFADVEISQCLSSLLLSNDRLHRSMRYQWQALTAHQSIKEYEFQDYIFELQEGMIENRVEKPDMTENVKTISGKTISVKCDRRQCAKRLMEIVERKTSIPRDQLYFVNQ